ncbi:putative oxidoreductase subunit [Escherichia coli]|nr:putative oxidoreductase subunit [Escherichia coli]
MYRWFLRHFPRGGSYADIHHALIEEGYTDWAESLVEYAWKKWLADENFAHQEVSSMQKLATDPGEIPFCSQFAAATIMLASAVVRITPESQPLGMPRKLPVWVIACGLEVSALTVTLAAPVNAHGLL